MTEPKREARHILDNIDNLSPDTPIRAMLRRGRQIVCTVGQLRAALAATALGGVETAARAVCDNVDPDPYALSRQMEEDPVCELCGAREEEETEHEEDCLWRLVEQLRAALGPAR